MTLNDRPELHPDRFAPPNMGREWSSQSVPMSEFVPKDGSIARGAEASTKSAGEREQDLSGLIDIALQNNPDTRLAWQQARAAAAQFGEAQASYYPHLAFNSSSGYQRVIIELPGTSGTLKQWQALPELDLTYVLLDFGRRRTIAEAARDHLIAANFGFNRVIQNVVFATQAAFYGFDAARAAVTVARRNLDLAQTDFIAVSQRVGLGLATEPELLLAKERLAESRFELANARLLVHDAEARMAIALGIAANELPPVQGLGNLL
ncbi:MAG TPA: TolC family protein, partial [Candidatus Binataceae bacterium]|nr:TolC family protein [Candidatus Binataceae bacterium]